MLKQLQKTPAKTFDKVNASPQAGYDLHLWAWLSDQTTKLMMENEALAAEINPAPQWNPPPPQNVGKAVETRWEGDLKKQMRGGRQKTLYEKIPPVILQADTPPSFLHLLLLFESSGWIGHSSTAQAITLPQQYTATLFTITMFILYSIMYLWVYSISYLFSYCLFLTIIIVYCNIDKVCKLAEARRLICITFSVAMLYVSSLLNTH